MKEKGFTGYSRSGARMAASFFPCLFLRIIGVPSCSLVRVGYFNFYQRFELIGRREVGYFKVGQ